MIKTEANKNYLFIALISFACASLLFTAGKPIGDFGNYYYGSKFFVEGKSVDSLYKDIHWFNTQIASCNEKDFFENYIPVPPFSLLFYAPFTLFNSNAAKFIFNFISCLLLLGSLYRFSKLVPNFNVRYLMVLPVLLVPLYNNVLQGQSYLLIAALLLEIFISYSKRNIFFTALYISLIFHLKLFPVFILGYFMFKKEWKIVWLSVLMIILLALITALAAGKDIVLNYYLEIVPRLFKNEIIDPFYSGYQSINILLKNLFWRDEISNPLPLLDLPLVAVFVESVFVSLVVYSAYHATKKMPAFESYSLFIFFGLLSSRYIPNYSLFILLPFAIYLLNDKKYLMLFLLFLVCTIPLNSLTDSVIPLKFIRVLLMIALFVTLLRHVKHKFDYKTAMACLFPILFLNIFTYQSSEPHYFKLNDSNRGVVYDFTIRNKEIEFRKCYGSSDSVFHADLPMTISDIRQIPANNFMSSFPSQNIKKTQLINDSLLVYLSDLSQGVGIYKFRILNIKTSGYEAIKSLVSSDEYR